MSRKRSRYKGRVDLYHFSTYYWSGSHCSNICILDTSVSNAEHRIRKFLDILGQDEYINTERLAFNFSYGLM